MSDTEVAEPHGGTLDHDGHGIVGRRKSVRVRRWVYGGGRACAQRASPRASPQPTTGPAGPATIDGMQSTLESDIEAPSPRRPPGQSGARGSAIVLRDVSKRYGRRLAVDGLTIDVPTGVVAGLIGPNGAGKTTAMAMLLGLVRPTAGAGTVLGGSLAQPAAYLHRVGALIEGPAFYPHLTGRQNLALLATLSRHDLARIPALLELVGLTDRGDDRFRHYSMGMKQRLGIAAALLGDPSLLILDEPANGLDPEGIHEMRDLIGTLGDGNRTVLVSSHVLSEVEQVCDWFIVIDDGRVVFQGPAVRLLGAENRLIAAPERPADLARLAAALERRGHDVHAGDGDVAVSVGDADPTLLAAALNRAAMEEGITLAELHRARADLESRYLSLIGRGSS
jgi:ABC-2 type transport system ATP-binding protein